MIHVGLPVSLFCKLAMVPTVLLKFVLRLGDSDDVTAVAVVVVLALLADALVVSCCSSFGKNFISIAKFIINHQTLRYF